MNNNPHYPFVSRQAQLVFYLMQMDGEQRANILGITEEHYSNAQLADEWYNALMHDLMPATEETMPAMTKLKHMYEMMTYRG